MRSNKVFRTRFSTWKAARAAAFSLPGEGIIARVVHFRRSCQARRVQSSLSCISPSSVEVETFTAYLFGRAIMCKGMAPSSPSNPADKYPGPLLVSANEMDWIILWDSWELRLMALNHQPTFGGAFAVIAWNKLDFPATFSVPLSYSGNTELASGKGAGNPACPRALEVEIIVCAAEYLR